MRSFVLRFGLLLVASYGMLYFSHKYYVPIHTDFGRYYEMYQRPLDFTVTPAPFVYRQVSAVLTHALYAAGVYYPNEIALADPQVDQRIFFAALVTNYLGLLFTATIAGTIAEQKTNGFSFPLLAGLLCLLSFHSQSVVVTGLTEGVAWLFVAGLYLLYLRENRVLFAAVLAVSIFQREMVSVAFGMIAAFSMVVGRGDRRYNIFVLGCSAVCFAAYLLMRIYGIGAPGYEFQLSPFRLIENLANPETESFRALLYQGVLSQNVMFIAVLLGAMVWARTREVPRDCLVLILTFIGIVAIGLAEGIDTNVGRIAGMLSPIFAAFAAIKLYQLDRPVIAHQP